MRKPFLRITLAGAVGVAALLPAFSENKPTNLIPESRPSASGKKYSIKDAFTVKDIPAGAKKVRAWFELPQEEALQNIGDLKIEAPAGWKIEKEEVQGNRFLYVEINDPKTATFDVKVSFNLERWQSEPSKEAARELTAEEKATLAVQLAEFPNGELTKEIGDKARELVKDEEDPVAQSRRIYDFIIGHAEYWKKDPTKWKASGLGSATYCMDRCTGNCTDFHALYQVMARTVDLPTQFVMGTALKADLDGVEKFDGTKKEPSYHCWVRTYFPGRGWVYSDISYADAMVEKKDKVDYYFDHIDDWRVTFSFGRNIDLAPKQDGAKQNWFIKCYVEVDGKEHAGWERELTYKSVK